MAAILDSEIRFLTAKQQTIRMQKREPAWVRRESLQEQEKDTRRKGSAWVGKQHIPEEEEDTNDDGNHAGKVGKEVKTKKTVIINEKVDRAR